MQRTRKLLWYHLNLPLARPLGSRQIRKAVPGLPVFAYCLSFSEAAPKGILRRPFFCLAPTGSSLQKGAWRVLVFINALWL